VKDAPPLWKFESPGQNVLIRVGAIEDTRLALNLPHLYTEGFTALISLAEKRIFFSWSKFFGSAVGPVPASKAETISRYPHQSYKMAAEPKVKSKGIL
jgi:hypothetical protein